MCNQCPEVFFKADGFVVFQGSPFGQTKWEVTENRLKITHIYGDPLIEGGEYSISFKNEGNEVELINNKNGDCYLMYRRQ